MPLRSHRQHERHGRSTRTRLRGLSATGLLCCCYALACALLRWGGEGAWQESQAGGPQGLDAAVRLSAVVGAWVVLTWLVTVSAGSLLTAVVAGVGSAAHRRASALAPSVSRRLVAAALGVSLATLLPGAAMSATAAASPTTTLAGPAPAALTVTATGAPATVPAPALTNPTLVPERPAGEAGEAWEAGEAREAGEAGEAREAGEASKVDDGWIPDRPVQRHRQGAGQVAAVRLVTSPPAAGLAVREEVIVRRGDTLWDLAGRHLGVGATAAEIAAEWPRWHHVNVGVIGADPDLLLPGTRLLPPSGR